MKRMVTLVILTIGLWGLGFLATVGALALLCAPTATALAPTTSSEVAAWIQAVAATLAILASAGIAVFVQWLENRQAKQQSADVAVEIALYARNVLQSVRDQLDSREKVHNVGDGTTYFDRHLLGDLWNMLSDVSLQQMRDVAITRELILLRGTVRQFRQNVEAAIDRYMSLDAQDYDVLFRVLNEAATAGSKVYANIKARADSV